MNITEFENILANGEGITVEFKEARNSLPKNLFQTICAFLNTNGGKILLGVQDDGSVSGIESKTAKKLRSDLANLSNNSQKIDPVFMLYSKEIEYKNQTVLFIDVPVSSMVHKCDGIIYARNEDGDYKIDRPEDIAAIVNRKQSYFTEQKAYPHISIDDFNPDLFHRAKRLIQSRSPGHAWVELTNNELLRRAGFYHKSQDGTEGYTLAAILFFGTDEIIQSLAPAYKFDAFLRKQNLDRYDDRLTVRTNLIDAYDLLMGFIAKHLNDPFYLEGDIRISLRDKIFRELVANIIAHREYLDARPATITIYEDKVVFKNPNNPHEKGIIDPKRFTPFSKNPIISRFMLQIGRVEEVGSGIRNVNKYLPLYSKGGKSEFIEDELFITNVVLKTQSDKTQKTTQKITQKILELIKVEPNMTRKKIAAITGNSEDSIKYHLHRMQQANLIRRVGPDKGGYWEIEEKIQSDTTQKITQKTTQKILELIKVQPNITRKKIAAITGNSEDSIKYHLNRMQQANLIRRVGPDKGGYWEVFEKKDYN